MGLVYGYGLSETLAETRANTRKDARLNECWTRRTCPQRWPRTAATKGCPPTAGTAATLVEIT